MPLLHSPAPQNTTPNPSGTVQQQDTEHRAGAGAFAAGYQPQPYSGFPSLPPPSLPHLQPSPHSRGCILSFFPSHLVIWHHLCLPSGCFYTGLLFFPFPLFSHTPDYLFYFCPTNSSVMMLGGKPTATKPPAVDTSHTDSLLSFEHLFKRILFRYSKRGTRGVGGELGEERGFVPEASLKSSKKGGFEHLTAHIFAYRLM